MKKTILLLIAFAICCTTNAEDGHNLWLRYETLNKAHVIAPKGGKTIQIAIDELKKYWNGKDLKLVIDKKLKNDDGFIYDADSICSHSEIGLLYGVYNALRIQLLSTNIKYC